MEISISKYNSFYDNCFPGVPAVIRFYIPDNAVHINQILLQGHAASFRAYSMATGGGGASSETTSEGGGDSVTSEWGGDSAPTSDYDGGQTSGPSSASTTDNTSITAGSVQTEDDATNIGKHNHGIPPGTGLITGVSLSGDAENGYSLNYSSVGWVPSGAHNHGSHRHSMNHTHSVPSHRHTVQIPAHKHTVGIKPHSHWLTLPSHSHGIQYACTRGRPRGR
ncbi:MAG: hypothetical protein LBK41_06555 [Clostridiales bacterium]|nr:hypothetical protein [Clostridiales bacterium]